MKKYLYILLIFIFSITLSYATPIGGGPISGGGGSGVTVSDDAYNSLTWDNNPDAASKNAIRDKIETLAGGHDAVTLNASAIAGGLGLSTQEITFRAATNAQTGYMTAILVTAIEANVSARHTSGSDTALGILSTKNPPIDADLFIYRDSTAGNALVTSTGTQIKAFLKAYFDTFYAVVLGADDNYVTDAEKIVIGNTSGTNTGDQTASTVSVITTSFGTNFTNDASHNTVQELMDIIDDLSLGGATAWDDIGDPDAAGTINLGTYQHLMQLGTAGAIRFGTTTDYFEFVEVSGDLIFRIVDGGTAGNIYFQGNWIFTGADATPSVSGNLLWDNVVSGLVRGGLVWFDETNPRYLLDFVTLPTADGQIPIYNATNDNFVPLVLSGGATMSQTGVVTVAASQTGVQATPDTTNPLAPTWTAAMHTVWYGATGEIDLPAAAGYLGRGILIFNTGAYTITIDPNGSEVIVRTGTAQTGGVSMTLSSGAGNFVFLFSDGARWSTLGFNGTLAAGS